MSATNTITTSQKSKANAVNSAYFALLGGILAASFAAILIRLALDAGLPSMLIATGRLGIAAVILTPIVLTRYRHELRNLRKRDIVFSALAGFWIATHFISLIISLDNTSVLVSQAISNSGPLWVAILEVIFLRATLSRPVWVGLGISIVGALLIAIAGATASTALIGDNPALGNTTAVFAAIAGAIYLTLGRRTRNHISIIPYVWILYTAGAITAGIALLVTQTPIVGHPIEGYVWLAILALMVQVGAHTGFNYAVGYLPATLVSLVGPIVTVAAGIIAFLIFQEVPLPLEIIGSIVIVTGVVMAVIGQRSRKSAAKRKA